MRQHPTWLLLFFLSTLSGAAESKKELPAKAKKEPAPEEKKELPLGAQPLEKIIKSYSFVADFNIKPELRKNGDEIFWRYPFRIPTPTFPMKPFPTDLPQATGQGRPYEHMNLGRRLYADGEFEEARKTWLSLRARYGEQFPLHRRNDYFIALGFFKQAIAREAEPNATDFRIHYANASTFLSYAFQVKKAFHDSYLDTVTPLAIYNLAATYFRFERFPAAFATASEGLDYLRLSGRKEQRADLHSVLAESFILNRSYLEAAQELDTALRQDPNHQLAFHVFNRMGDIYMDLNNFELADDAYETAIHLAVKMDAIPSFILAARGEALFWMGNYGEAIRHFELALNNRSHLQAKTSLQRDMHTLASLRLADSLLAKKDFDKAKLAYFEHIRAFPKDLTSDFARVRLACMELPAYKGNNVLHARKELEKLRQKALNKPAKELAWACEVGSYTQRERTASMLDRIREFAKEYGNSRFLASFHQPVLETQAATITQYLEPYEPYGLITFYEANKKELFQKLPDQVALNLFRAYVDTDQSKKALEFQNAFLKAKPSTSEDLLRTIVAAAENQDGKSPSELEKYAEKLRQETEPSAYKWDPESELMIARLLVADPRAASKLWAYQIYLQQLKNDFSLLCSHIYPTLADIIDQKIYLDKKSLVDETKTVFEKELPKAFLSDIPCALSILNSELKLYQDTIPSYSELLLKRNYIPFTVETARFYWKVASLLEKSGKEKERSQVLRFLADKKETQFPEVRFAKQQLEKLETETGKMWQ